LSTTAGAAAAGVIFFLFSTTGPFQGHTLPFLVRVTPALFRNTVIERKVIVYIIIYFIICFIFKFMFKL
jgi:hypothetical protein